MKVLKFCICAFVVVLSACAGASDGSDLEVPTNLPPICQGLDFTKDPDLRDVCGVRRARYKAYHNIPQQRYLIKPANASLVKENNRIELRLQNTLPIELNGLITKEIIFSQEKRLEKIKNTYDYIELFEKGNGRTRVFKLGIPTDMSTSYDFCFMIPEKGGNARTRSVAMGTNIEMISCHEFESVKAKKSSQK